MILSNRDQLVHALRKRSLVLNESDEIQWHHDNIDHPRNWSTAKKLYSTAIITFLEFFTTAISTAGTTVALQAQSQLGLSSNLTIFTFTGVYSIGQAIGSIFFPPCSETFGRRTLYISSTLLYAVFCLPIAVKPTSLASIIICRLLGGLVSCIPTVVGAGSLEDMYSTRSRVWAVYVWATIGNLGLVLGPIFAAFVSVSLGWRWIFYLAAAIMGAAFIACLWMSETRPSLLLQREIKSIREEVSIDVIDAARHIDHVGNRKFFFKICVVRPLHLLSTEPIVMLVAFLGSFANGIFYLLVPALHVVYSAPPFSFSLQFESLAFIPLGIGLALGIFLRVYEVPRLSYASKGRPIEPEDKLLGFWIAVPCLATGLWWFAWTVPPAVHVHWIVSMAALIPMGFALNEFVYTLSGYLADSYTTYGSSAFAGLSLTRTAVTAVFLPFANTFYERLGPNRATSLLAGVATLFCVAPVVLQQYGKRLRARSQFAVRNLEVRLRDGIGEGNVEGLNTV